MDYQALHKSQSDIGNNKKNISTFWWKKNALSGALYQSQREREVVTETKAITNLSEHKMFWNYIMVNVLKFIGLFHAHKSIRAQNVLELYYGKCFEIYRFIPCFWHIFNF